MAKKILLGALAVFVLAILIILSLAAAKPDTLHVERKLVMQGTPEDVFPYANDLAEFVEWMPWAELDPDQTIEFSEPTSGVGAWYTWAGNDDVGEGRMEVLSAAPGEVVHELRFIEPFESEARSTISMKAVGDDRVEVTWAYDQDADFGTKLMTVFVDMDSMLGADFDKGLARLQPLVEAD
jgi:hypothetical protein